MFSRSALHEHAEPAQRVRGIAELPPDSGELARLLAADPAPEVRAAAAARCADLGALAAAWESESESSVRLALAAALGHALAETQDAAGAKAMLETTRIDDAIRAEVARRTHDADRRRTAIGGIRDESRLVELALTGDLAETRMAAAQQVRTPEGLRRLADEGKSKDRGVARLAHQRIDAIKHHHVQGKEADAIIAQLEALASVPGPILTTLVELNRRWQALDMSGDAERLARCDAARQGLQARFDREQAELAARARLDRKVREWMTTLGPPATPDVLAALKGELAALREEAQACADATALATLDQAAERIALREQEFQALAGTEALVVEAEQLAAGTSIDNASLPERWQALDRSVRTPALTRRFEAALMVVESRRLAQVNAAQQEEKAARQQVQALLQAAEHALAAGQLQAARAVADEIRAHKGAAGTLPKPLQQRLGHLMHELVELERWESFGQRNARIQLCERAEAAAAQTPDPPRLAIEVRKLREEWKALDQQHPGVPKALWERFDGACERAYAPVARHYAELAAQRKQARKQREEFIAAAAAHASTLLTEPRDWRAIERWLRETDHAWREGDLGSVDPGAWKKLDAQLKLGLAPLRDALTAAREEAKAGRQALINQALELGTKAMERDTLTQVKAIQARWQEQAKALSLLQRDERALWEQFRAACDAVFEARHSKRKEEDGRKHDKRRALEEVCAQLAQLARETQKDEPEIRAAFRHLQEEWKKHASGFDPSLRAVESRFKDAKAAVEAMLSSRARSREAAVWQSLSAKERLCEDLDRLAMATASPGDAAELSASTLERWAALPALLPAWERKIVARRDGALRALAEAGATAEYRSRVEKGAESRLECLLELEMLLGIESPAECHAQRLALQVKKLKERFSGEAASGKAGAGERMLEWCAMPGVAEARDRERCERVLAALAKA